MLFIVDLYLLQICSIMHVHACSYNALTALYYTSDSATGAALHGKLLKLHEKQNHGVRAQVCNLCNWGITKMNKKIMKILVRILHCKIDGQWLIHVYTGFQYLYTFF